MHDKTDKTDNTESDTRIRCDRAAFLVDGSAYFSALGQALDRAERTILIIGWDIDSRIRLDNQSDGTRLYEMLNGLVDERPELDIHVLVWDYPLAYSMDREPLQQLEFPRKTHRRIVFHLDDELPMGSSHHQKIVVIDDRVAFVGGMDITAGRWDRPEHAPDDPDRVGPDGEPYPPYHDVQMVVEGELAAQVGTVARQRWLWATGETLSPAGETEAAPWPGSVSPELEDLHGTIALTLPPYKGRKQRREVEALYLRAIKEARHTIYMENQYFTSATIRDALAKRLDSEDCPEIVIILPQMTSGLLEQLVMEPLQSDVLDDLADRDVHDRLTVLCPFADEQASVPIKIHSKLLIVDDELVTVGSANLNERSMGLDSECNLVFESPELRDPLRAFRQSLIAHQLGMAEDRVRATEKDKGMLGAVRDLTEESGRLVPECRARNSEGLPMDPEIVRQLDSSMPGLYDTILDAFSGEDNSRQSYRGFMGFGAVLALFVVLAVTWRFSPLSEHLTPDGLLHWAAQLRQMPWSPALAVLAFVLGGFVLFPVTLLIVLTASIFSPLVATLISLAGSLASALSVYWAGELLGHRWVKRLAGPKVRTVSRTLGRHGMASIIVTRIVPVAPFSIINLIAGASHINLSTFLAGTAVGMAPGIIGMTLFGGQLIEAIRNPTPATVALLLLIILAVVGLGMFLRHRLRRVQEDLSASDNISNDDLKDEKEDKNRDAA